MAYPRLLSFVAAASLLAACSSHVPARVQTAPGSTVEVQILAFNDLHGNLDPPQGATGRAGDVAVGGIEYLATHVARLRDTNPNTAIVAAGDNIGASPLLSALFHDEPTIEALNALGLDFSAAGNHEFDEGWRELLRMQHGGCHPVDGCRGDATFPGASFKYLAANVRVDATNTALFPASAMKVFDGVPVGFVGLALALTPSVAPPAAVNGVTFLDEAEAANTAAAALRAQGAAAVVALIHEGGYIAPNDTSENCATMTGRFAGVIDRMSADIDVVVSGHTNRDYICRIGGKLVTSTTSFSRYLTDIDLTIDRNTRRVVSSRARNLPVTRDVPPERTLTAVLDRYRPAAASVGNRQVGTLAASLTRTFGPSGETSLGNAVADVFLTMANTPEQGGADIAIVNWGGLRVDLLHPDGAATATPAPLAYSTVFSLMPFGNTFIVKELTGDGLLRLLEQQFDNPAPGQRTILQVSRTLQYAYNPARPAGTRVVADSVRVNGQPLERGRVYRVAMSDFLWSGGDSFSSAAAAAGGRAMGVDIELFLEYLKMHSPLGLAPAGRILLAP